MAWSFVSVGTRATGASPTIALPAGYAAGDLFVLVIACTSSNTLPTTISGWTNAAVDNTNAAVNISIFYKANVTGSETTPSFTGGDSTCSSQIFCYRGLTSTPFDVVSTVSVLYPSVTTHTAPTLTTTVANDLVITMYCYDSATNTIATPPTGVTNRVNNLGNGTITGTWIGDENVSTTSTTTARSLVFGTATFGDIVQVAFLQSAGAVASQPPEQDWIEEEYSDDWLEWQSDSQPVGANVVATPISAQTDWDHAVDDLTDELVEWQYDSEPRKTDNNKILGFQDNIEILDEVIDDELWHVIDDGFNVRNANAVASVTYQVDDGWQHFDEVIDDEYQADDYQLINSVVVVAQPTEDGWQHFEGEDCADDEWIIRIDEDDAVEPPNLPVVKSIDDAWPYFDDELNDEEQWLVQVDEDDGAESDNNPLVASQFDWDFDEAFEDEQWIVLIDEDDGAESDNNPLVSSQDEWDWSELADEELTAEDYLQSVVTVAPNNNFDEAWHHDDDVDDEIYLDEYQNSSVVLATPQAFDDLWLDEDLEDDLPQDSYALVDNNPLVNNQDDWDWQEWFDDDLVSDDYQTIVVVIPQAQVFDDAWSFDDDVDDEFYVEDYQQASVVAVQSTPCNDGWYHEDDIDDDWYLDEYLSISASVQVAFLPDDSFAHFDEFVEDEYLLDEFQQVTQQDQPTDLIYDFDDVLDDDWFYDQSINENLVLNFVAPFPDEWDWFEEVSDEWTVDEVLLINTSVVILYTNPRFIVVAKIRALSVATVSRTLKIIASARFLKVTAQPQQRTVVASSRKYKV